jgi:hypothetical protein
LAQEDKVEVEEDDDEIQSSQKEYADSKDSSVFSVPIPSWLKPSPSVSNAVDHFNPSQKISASALAQQILLFHSEYAYGMAGSIKLEDTVTKMSASKWLEQIQTVFDPNIIRKYRNLSISDYPELHGRLVIIGLSLLEPSLAGQFDRISSNVFCWNEIPGNDNTRLIKFLNQEFRIEWAISARIEKIDDSKTIKVSTEKNSLTLKLDDKNTEAILEIDDGRTIKLIAKMEEGKLNIYIKAFDALVYELRNYVPPDPLPEILTAEGRVLWDNLKPDTVPNWGDDPLQKLEDDLLGRAAFARYMVKRIDAAAAQYNFRAYVMLLFGPWGSGKSTVLNFIRDELKNKDLTKYDWLVVDYNAWRNQHIQPPWWSLMDSVFQSTKANLTWQDQMREYWWRFYTGRQQYLIGIAALVALAWILAYIGLPFLNSNTPSNVTTAAPMNKTVSDIATYADNIGKLLAIVATLWGAILALNNSLLSRSPQAAQSYAELTTDPSGEIKNRFQDLICRLINIDKDFKEGDKKPEKRVIIFIDDLDRCNSDYVVRLLEGIQTLFRDASVIFLIAADRRWLNACYEDVYEKLKSRVFEPGKPLGTLFLEKAFRFSAPMPGIPEKLKEQFWSYLLQVEPSERKTDQDKAKNEAKTMIAGAKSEAELRRLSANSPDRSFALQRALREEAAIKLATPEILERLEHTLMPYSELLEPNPRSMKLLVNAYSANRVLAFLSGVDIELHQLVLWTILSSRWPNLANYLEKNPDYLAEIGPEKDASEITEELRPLFSDKEVAKVIEGGSMTSPLIRDTVEKCGKMHA